MLEHIEKASNIALITHKNPDADSLGCACAMYIHLLRLQKKVSLFCSTSPVDPKLKSIPFSEKLKHNYPQNTDLAICFDCGSLDRLGVDVKTPLINIDHHKSNSSFADVNLVDKSAISTATVLLRWFRDNNISVNTKMATALYASIADDSLGFMSSKVDETTFDDCAYLKRCGADIYSVNKGLFLSSSLARLRLRAIMLQGFRLVCDGRVALLRVSRDDLVKSGAKMEHSSDAFDDLLNLPTPLVCVLIREREDVGVRVSLRSNRGVDVDSIAREFGGGGHSNSSGFIDKCTNVDQIEQSIITTIERSL